MGRKKVNEELKRKTISVSLDEQVFIDLDNLQVKNKSQLINWLLREHFNVFNQKSI
jgi:hypothetical protein